MKGGCDGRANVSNRNRFGLTNYWSARTRREEEMNVTKTEFMSLIKTFEDFDEETQLRIYNNWRTFQQMFWLLEHHPLAWMLIKSAINDVYHKSVAQSN